jgi:hypothetical protein
MTVHGAISNADKTTTVQNSSANRKWGQIYFVGNGRGEKMGQYVFILQVQQVGRTVIREVYDVPSERLMALQQAPEAVYHYSRQFKPKTSRLEPSWHSTRF